MTCNILLVDDDDVAVESIQRNMKKAGLDFSITVAEDGLVALDILRGLSAEKSIKDPFIVLLDLNMPRMNGFEFLHTIRADEKLKPTIVFILTTSGSDVDIASAYHENIAGYMVKDKVGPQFSKLFKLLNDYANAVNLPALKLN
jgi:CheY-like chemotaxis protein